jgi:hypothetical protein
MSPGICLVLFLFSLNKLINFLFVNLAGGMINAFVMFFLNLDLSIIKSDQREWFFFSRRPVRKDETAPVKPITPPKLWPTHEPLNSLESTITISNNPDNRIAENSGSKINSNLNSKIHNNPNSKIYRNVHPQDAKQLVWSTDHRRRLLEKHR